MSTALICARNLSINFTLQFHAILTDSKFLFEADAGALIEHMVGDVGDTVGASWHAHCVAGNLVILPIS